MKKTFFRVKHSYNAGLLGTHKDYDSLAEARAFAENYKINFDDCEKWYNIIKITHIVLFGIVIKATAEIIEDWSEWDEE